MDRRVSFYRVRNCTELHDLPSCPDHHEYRSATRTTTATTIKHKSHARVRFLCSFPRLSLLLSPARKNDIHNVPRIERYETTYGNRLVSHLVCIQAFRAVRLGVRGEGLLFPINSVINAIPSLSEKIKDGSVQCREGQWEQERMSGNDLTHRG
jgi:hypothetical protein